MNKFWCEVLTLPYKFNSRDNPLHEQQVEALLKKYGFNYEHEPNGKQKSPDFRVTLDNGRTVDIECKSSATEAHPTYNGGLPKEGVVYIFSSKIYDKTTIYFAEDIVTEKKRQQYASLIKEIKSIVKIYQMDEEWEDESRGFDYYPRNMYTQKGGKVKTDYFTHNDRERCEQNVLNHQW